MSKYNVYVRIEFDDGNDNYIEEDEIKAGEVATLGEAVAAVEVLEQELSSVPGVLDTIQVPASGRELRLGIDLMVDRVMAEYHQIVNDDCLGSMMVFMDMVYYPYSCRSGLTVWQENDHIRTCFKHAYLEYIGDVVINELLSKVRSKIFGGDNDE